MNIKKEYMLYFGFVLSFCLISWNVNAEESEEIAEILTMDIDEIPIENEFEELGDDPEPNMELLANSNPVKTTCTLTDKRNNGWYRGVTITAVNRTNSSKTCTFKCVVGQSSGRDRQVSCRSTLVGNQSARVCRYYNSSSNMKGVKSVSDGSGC